MNVLTLDETILKAYDDLARFNDRVYSQDVINHLSQQVPYTNIESGQKQCGCFGGPCACTGACQELVSATKIDALLNTVHRLIQHMVKDTKQVLLQHGRKISDG